MKKYIATFWRSNPQIQGGGYETERTIEAKTIASAIRKARDYENCLYGSKKLLKVELVE